MTDIYNLKLLFIGDSSVGKSSLLLRFADETWLPEDETSATIGVDFRVHRMQTKDGKKVKLSIWDTAGQERFRTIISSYYRGAQGIIIVYDVSNRETFEGLPKWMSELSTYLSSDVVKIIVGNKVDKEHSRQVTEDEGRKFAGRHGCLFIEASAKTAVGVRETFVDLVEKIIQTPELWSAAAPKGVPNQPGVAMPGNISLSAPAVAASSNTIDGCSC